MFLDYYNLQPLFMAIHSALCSVMPEGLAIFLEGLVVGVVILVLYAVLAIILIYMERKVCAAFQCRIGPNRVGGKGGLLQVPADVIKILTNYRTVYLPDKASVSCVDDKLKNTNSEYVFVLYHKTRKMREILAHLVSTVKTGCVDDGVVHAVPIVISEESFQAENMEDFFVIHMEEKNNNVELRVDEVVPDDDQLSVVQDKIFLFS